MSRNTLLISIIFFGCPIVLFMGSYYFEYKNKNEELDLSSSFEESQNATIFHSIDKYLFSISGNIKRLSSNKLEVRDLELYNKNAGKLLVKTNKIIKSIINLNKKGIEIIEYLRLPNNENWELEEVKISRNYISVKNNEIINNSEFVLKPLKVLKEKIGEVKSEVQQKLSFDLSKDEEQIKNLIRKLLICAFNQDKYSLEIINNFQKHFSVEFQGSLLEWYNVIVEKANMAFNQ